MTELVRNACYQLRRNGVDDSDARNSERAIGSITTRVGMRSLWLYILGIPLNIYALWPLLSTMRSRISASLGSLATLFFSGIACNARPGVESQIALLESSNSSLLQYPTDFTQNILPKPIHSHNDYWRDVPLLTALSFGVVSVEADVWLINGTLFMGHELAALTENRTFDSLYVEPLVQIIEKQNPQNAFTVNQTTFNGVFDMAGEVPLQLLVDVKTDGVEALPVILDALDPLRSRGFLTTASNGTFSLRPIVVVGTGNSPLEQVKALEPRDYFFDAPLEQLGDTTLNTEWDITLSPLASTDYSAVIGWNGIGNISDDQRSRITSLVNDAHSRGIRARFWDTPGWPLSARDNVWRELLNAGADWLNADDLEAASKF